MSDYYDNSYDNGYEVSEKKVGNVIDGLDRGIDAALDKEISSMINSRSIVCGLCCVIPLAGIETIVYAICLWGMYGKIADKAKTPFKKNLLKNILGGFTVNWIIVLILNFICEFFTIAGGLGLVMSFLVGFIATKMSGASFVGMLKLMHGKKAKVKLDVEAGVKAAFSKSQEKQLDIPPVPQKAGELQSLMPPPMPVTSSNKLLVCPDCGLQVSRHAEYCPNCGCPTSEMN